MAELIASRNASTSASRLLIQQTYENNANIELSNPQSKLRAFSRFISALSMYNTVLASAVGADGVLTASDISAGECANDINVCGPTANLPDTAGAGQDPSDLNSATNWSNTPSMEMLWTALSAAESDAADFAGSQSGILSAINQILNLNPSFPAEKAKRQQLIVILGLQ
jgi:hypothetical protein